MHVDLHTHTVRSDGTTTPSQNAALAADAGLAGLAITDHDTIDGWEEAAEACAARGIAFIPGLELSTEVGGVSVHVLGYWVDPEDPALAAECDRLRRERLHRATRIVALLDGLGAPVALDRVLARAGGAPVGRPHIAAAMVEAGHVADIGAAFDGYLRDGGPAWVEKHAVDPTDGVRLIRAAGGVAVLAHPARTDLGHGDLVALIDQMALAGLAGIEADHAGHTSEEAAAWRRVADVRGLAATGSSDFHGDRTQVRLGASVTPHHVVAALAERARPSTVGGRSAW